VKKAAYAAFRHLPPPLRRAAVRAGAPSFTVGAVAVLRRGDGQVVFVEQRHSDGWALPGGLLRRGETPADAVVREVAEETGVRLTPHDLPVPVAAVAPGVRRVDVVFIVDVDGDVVMRAEDRAEVKGLGWFRLDAAPPVTGPTVDILRAVRLW
jgi:ADP-ribose pyrophosphatase YjhB (NUDIX family)